MKVTISQCLRTIMISMLLWVAESAMNLARAQTASELLKHIDKIYTSDQATLKAADIDTMDGESGYSIRYQCKIQLNGLETILIESHSAGEDEPYYLTQCFGDEKKDYSSIFEELVEKLVSKYPELELDDSDDPDTNHNIYSTIKRIASLNDKEGSEVITAQIWSDGGMKITIR